VLTSYLVANAVVLPSSSWFSLRFGRKNFLLIDIVIFTVSSFLCGAAMAVFALGVVVAPVLGPTLGGWLTDEYSWRWAFYINVPVGIVALLMISRFIENTADTSRACPVPPVRAPACFLLKMPRATS
jgi:DHA2 family multidrug resistance protein